jgi:microcystin-dependent protein
VKLFAGNSSALNTMYVRGWRIADGTDGTIDLIDSFPKMGTFAQKGGAGGAKIITPSGSVSVANHTLSKSQMPIHAHSLRVGYTPGGENGPEEGGRDWSGVTATESEGGSDPHAHGASFSGTNHTNEPQFTYLVPLYFTGVAGSYS